MQPRAGSPCWLNPAWEKCTHEQTCSLAAKNHLRLVMSQWKEHIVTQKSFAAHKIMPGYCCCQWKTFVHHHDVTQKILVECNFIMQDSAARISSKIFPGYSCCKQLDTQPLELWQWHWYLPPTRLLAESATEITVLWIPPWLLAAQRSETYNTHRYPRFKVAHRLSGPSSSPCTQCTVLWRGLETATGSNRSNGSNHNV